MYQPLYNFNKAPFQASIDPDFFWWGTNSEKILNNLRSDLEHQGRLTLVTGGPGSGKTTLMYMVLAELAPQMLVAMIADPRLTIEEFYDSTTYALLLPGRCKNRQQFHEQIRSLVRKAGEQKRNVLLVIDEAQQLSPELIVELKEIIELFSNTSERLSVCLVGQLEDTYGTQGPIIKAFRNYELVLHHLEPLTSEETGIYIQHRLKVAGCQQKIFTDDAFLEIHQFSGGYPGQINIICDVALFIGSTMQAGAIDAGLIRSNAEKFQFAGASHRSTDRNRSVESNRMACQGNDDIDRSVRDDDDAMVARNQHCTALKYADSTSGEQRVAKQTGARHFLGLFFVLVLGGGGYLYYASSMADHAEFSVVQLAEGMDTGTEFSVEQMTGVSNMGHQQVETFASPDQVDGLVDKTGNSSVNETFLSMQEEESDIQAEAESSKGMAHGAGEETGLGEVRTSDIDELLLPQLQEEIQAVLQEASQTLLLDKQDSPLPDTEEIAAVDLETLDTLESDGSGRNEAAAPVAEERVRLKNFLEAGSFDIVTTPAPRETADTSNGERPVGNLPARESLREEMEPDP